VEARTDRLRPLVPLLFLLAAAPARGGELRLALPVEELALCAGETVALAVESDEAPALAASAGVVGAPVADGPGRWSALYRPPEECHPQVALLSVTAGGRWAWGVLRLVGQGEALVRTGPGAVISVRIGSREFGPARADGQGRALVPVVVPPGVRSAWHGKREIPLQLPPARRVHVALDRSALPADGAGEVTVRAFAARDEGGPSAGELPVLAVSQGSLETPRPVEPGVVEARWRLGPGKAVPAVVTAALAGDAGEPAQAVLPRPAGAPVSLELVAEPPTLVAGEGPELQVTARLRDAQGNPATGPVALTTSFGEVAAFAERSAGEWTGQILVPPARGGLRRLRLAAEAGGARGELLVALRPGAPARLSLSMVEVALRADGHGQAEMLLRASDAFGNLCDEPPSLGAELGRVGAPLPGPDGGWRATYTPPRLESASWEGLSARLGAAREHRRLRLLPRPHGLEVAAKVGVRAGGGSTGPTGAVELAWWPERLRGRAGLAAELGAWAFQRTDRTAVGGQPVVLRGAAQLVPLTVTALYRLHLGERGAAWLGAGGGAVLLSGRLDQGSLRGPVRTGLAPEAHAVAGGGLELGRLAPFVEAGLGWQGDAGLESLKGSLVTWTVQGGVRLGMH